MWTHLNQALYSFLDHERVRLEATGQLPCHFVDQVIVCHVFAVLHNPDDAGLCNKDMKSVHADWR